MKVTNLEATGSIKGKHIGDVSGNLTGNVIGNVTGNVTGNVAGDVSGNIYNKKNMARFIVVGNADPIGINREDFWTLKEIQVFDNSGNNIALNKPIKVTKGTSAFPNNSTWGKVKNLNNGNAKAEDNDGYRGNTGENEVEIDLSNDNENKELAINQIVLYNRYHSEVAQRANGTSIKLLDKNRNLNRIIHTGNWLTIYSKEYTL